MRPHTRLHNNQKNVVFITENAKEALELSKMQETTRQHELQSKMKEYEAAMEQVFSIFGIYGL